MTEDEVLNEVQSTFQTAMGHDSNFPFASFKPIPAVSALFTWTAKEVVKLSGQGCLYIQTPFTR